MDALYLYLFEDPGWFCQGEYIGVVESSEQEALNKLEKHLVNNNREKDVMIENQYTRNGEQCTSRSKWKVICSVPVDKLVPGVIDELHHEYYV